jgi:hypothetical protein
MMDKKQIQARIGKIGRAIATITKDVQETAVEITFHALAHGDVTLADELISALGKVARRQSLLAWFEKNGPFVFQSLGKKFCLDKERAKEMRKANPDELRAKLMALPWQDALPEPELASTLDCSEAVDKFLKRLHKQVQEGTMEIRNRDLLDRLEQVTAEWHARKVLQSIPAAEPEELAKVYTNLKVPTPNAPVPGLIHLLTN